MLPTVRYIPARMVAPLVECIRYRLNVTSFGKFGQPLPRYSTDPIIRPGYLTAYGGCRICIIAKVGSVKNRLSIIIRLMKAPQRCLKALYDISTALDLIHTLFTEATLNDILNGQSELMV